MISNLGFYSLVFGLILSMLIIFQSSLSIKSKEINFSLSIYSYVFLQFFFVMLSFSCLILSFVISDFGNITVFNNSHSSKPLFYKISGVWGNHEGSLLLWLLVLTSFLFIFIITSKKSENKYRLLTILFQQLIIF